MKDFTQEEINKLIEQFYASGEPTPERFEFASISLNFVWARGQLQAVKSTTNEEKLEYALTEIDANTELSTRRKIHTRRFLQDMFTRKTPFQ